jgi:uncharacterized protein YkwD
MTYLRSAFGVAVVALALYGLNQVVTLAPAPVVYCPPPAVVRKPAPVGNPYEREVIRLTNLERTSRGLKPLKTNTKMMADARQWSKVQAGSRMHHSKMGYGENVAVGQETPAAVTRAWMLSPGHRRNIMSSRYSEIGVGYVEDGRGRAYWTQVFR